MELFRRGTVLSAKCTIEAMERLHELTSGYWVSMAFFASLELGIFDALSEGPLTAEEMGRRLGLHAEAVERLLIALLAIGLVQRSHGRYTNTPFTQSYLIRGGQSYLGGLSAYKRFYRHWEYLADAIRENSPRWEQAFGLPASQVFENIYRDPQGLRWFLEYMHTETSPVGEEVAMAFDFKPYRCLLDVGGGSGAMAIQAALRYPHLKAVVFDLPPVCQIAAEFIAQHGLSDRISTHPGDFFKAEDFPKGADVITLSWVLHDWPNEKSNIILSNCFNALPAGGGIVLSEGLLDDNRDGPLWDALYSLHMLVVTDGGRERTAQEYKTLMTEAGFVELIDKELAGSRDLITGRRP